MEEKEEVRIALNDTLVDVLLGESTKQAEDGIDSDNEILYVENEAGVAPRQSPSPSLQPPFMTVDDKCGDWRKRRRNVACRTCLTTLARRSWPGWRGGISKGQASGHPLLQLFSGCCWGSRLDGSRRYNTNTRTAVVVMQIFAYKLLYSYSTGDRGGKWHARRDYRP